MARRLAEVFASASDVVTRAEEGIRAREEETRRAAEVLGRVDAGARRRVMAARRAASAAELQASQALAEELRYQAGSRALGAVHRYAGTLVHEAEEANAAGRAKLAELGDVLDSLDVGQARTLLELIEKAEAQRLANAQKQAEELTAQIQLALGSLPAPPAEFDEARPKSRKARRRARRDKIVEQPEVEDDAVVQLDPFRRRTAN
jgi:hypothetical protein